MSSSLRLTIDEYETMIANGAFVGRDRRLELIHGTIRGMNPASPLHYDYIDFLNYWSHQSIERTEATIQIQSAIQLGNSMPEPDVMWLRPKRYGGQRPRANDALLIVEVADSSLRYDLGEKAMLYAHAGIAEYWVVDMASQLVHQHRQPTVDGYEDIQQFDRSSSVRPLVKRDAELRLADLFSEA